MVLDLIVGFAVLVAASYIGTTMALRGYFDDAVGDDTVPDSDSAGGSSDDD